MNGWNGKRKALTFSFDDGVTQDRRLIEMFNRYGLKCTFNLNSELLGTTNSLERNAHRVSHDKVSPDEVATLYAGHEVAVHTLTHPMLPELEEAEVVRQVEQDRLTLSRLAGYEVVGMAYPGGGKNYDERVAQIIREKTGVRYARTIASNHSFQPQQALHTFHPTVHFIDEADLFRLGEQFLALDAQQESLFYVWGHSYEMDAEYISWERFEEFCRMMAGRDDIFYGTNREVLRV